MELSQDQQALLSYILDAYNKHRIPPDMAKKLVNRYCIFNSFNELCEKIVTLTFAAAKVSK